MNFIDEIKNRVNIVDLACEVGLKIFKNNFIKSIYKSEQNPSLKIYEETNTFKCYATGEQGDVIKFYMDYHRIDFKEALRELAAKAGIERQETGVRSQKNEVSNRKTMSKKQNRIERRVSILKSEMEYFDERAGIYEYTMGLTKNQAERNALDDLFNQRKEIQLLIYDSLEKYCFGVDEETFNYLTGITRGLSFESIKKFRLFSIKNRLTMKEYLQDCFTKDQLVIAGLFNKKGNFVFEFHQLIIPYIEQNKLTYLRGRVVGTTQTKYKYISLTNYSRNLSIKRFYNADVLTEMRRDEKLIVCEGEFDTMILEQEGYKAIGVPGVTNIPIEKINLIRNYDLYLAFDNDEAGEIAIQKMTNLLNRPIKAIKLKQHKDITEMINERHQRANF